MARRSVASDRQRPLGSFERAQALTGRRFPYNLVAVVGLEGELDPDRLRWALDEIQRRTPLLRARLTGEGRRAVFQLDSTPPLPLRLVEASRPGDWKRRVEEELDTGFDAGRGPLARCLHVASKRGDGAGELILTFHHVIVDGVAVARLARDLLSLCAGHHPPPGKEEEALPPSADEQFPRRYRVAGGGLAGMRFLLRQTADEVSFRRRRRQRPSRPATGATRCRILTAELTPEETGALVRASRRRCLSLTAVLEAAMLLAVSRCRYGGERLPLRYFAFPMLRPYLEPSVDETIFGSYLAAMRFTLEVGGDDGLWPVAAEVGGQIYDAVRRGEKFLASIWSPLSMKMILHQSGQRMSTIALSYTGPVVPEIDRPPGSDAPWVREVHAFVSNFAVGPEYTAQARIHRRRLVWDIVHLDVDMTPEEAREIAEEMRRLVTAGAEDYGRSP